MADTYARKKEEKRRVKWTLLLTHNLFAHNRLKSNTEYTVGENSVVVI